MAQAERISDPSLFVEASYVRKCVRFHDALVDVLDEVLSVAAVKDQLKDDLTLLRGLTLLDEVEGLT